MSKLVKSATQLIGEGYLNERSVGDLAAEFGVTPRHLRRALADQLGVSPVALAQSRRLALAKQLLQDTALGVAEIAFASGFQSVRRFNDLFVNRFGASPATVRRRQESSASDQELVIRLDYRTPFDWEGLLGFVGHRAIPGVEQVIDNEFRRVVHLAGRTGIVRVRRDVAKSALRAHFSISLAGALMPLVSKLRQFFDLDAKPMAIAEHFETDNLIGPMVLRRPGLRLPSAMDAFEMAARAVFGQQISVGAATTLAGRFATRFGEAIEYPQFPGLTHRFPSAQEVADQAVEDIRAIGIPRNRANTLKNVAIAFAASKCRAQLAGGDPMAALISDLAKVPGIGPWTLQYIAMRGFHEPDAFPASDLGIRKALGGLSPKAAEARAEVWRPWRSYAALHLWTHFAARESH